MISISTAKRLLELSLFLTTLWCSCSPVVATNVNLRSEAQTTAYKNPMISGFAPDPSCIRIEEQFFCVTSSFSAFPGIPVYTSRDLVQWKQIGNVLSRPEQLPALNTVNSSTGGIWAATIRHHDDTFYVITTLVLDQNAKESPDRWDNLIFTNKDIFANDGNGWSDPVHFSFQGYDTSLFWDDDVDGKVYVTGSHYWRVLPGIEQFEIDLATGASLSGDAVVISNGTGATAPEGPHMYKRDDGYYYLLLAEGGTGVGHEVTMFRGTNVWGPFDPCPYNPVYTNTNTSLYLQTVGHADLFNDTNGNWWIVALATRNATVNYPMGRETVLAPAVWEVGEFPVVNGGKPGHAYIDMEGPLPPKKSPTAFQSSDPLVAHTQKVTFAPGTSLPRQFIYFRYPDFTQFTVSPKGHPNTLRIVGSAENITGVDGGLGTSTFVARRQDAVEFTATVDLEFAPINDGEEAGMTLFIQRLQHFDLGLIAIEDGNAGTRRYIQLKTITANSTNSGASDPLSKPGIVELPSGTNTLSLKVQAANASTYTFSYATPGKGREKWEIVGYGAASEVSGGYTGTLVGMYATGNGRNSTSPAYFSNFVYTPVQGVY